MSKASHNNKDNEEGELQFLSCWKRQQIRDTRKGH